MLDSKASDYRDDPKVTAWATQTLAEEQNLGAVRARSDIVNARLIQLDPELGRQHKKAVEAALATKAGTHDMVGAAQRLDRLLERFKGELIQRCRRGNKATYRRIAENLAVDTELTRGAITAGQAIYEALHKELIDTRKLNEDNTGNRILELLRQVEEHIKVVTDAIDSDKIGIQFLGHP